MNVNLLQSNIYIWFLIHGYCYEQHSSAASVQLSVMSHLESIGIPELHIYLYFSVPFMVK